MTRSAEIPYDSRCVACRDGLDRVGRYCARCLRSRRLKLFFGTIAFAQCAAVAVFVTQSKGVTRVIPSDGLHTVVVQTPAGPSGWYYYDVTDPLIGDVAHHARIIADTPLAPKGAPASPGASAGTLEVSFSRHYGKSAVLTFPPVKRACAANVCELRVIFDKDAPEVLVYDDVSDHRATVLMLTDAAAFLKRLPSAHDLTFVASLGTEADTTVSFNVEGFRLKMAAVSQRVRVADMEKKPGGMWHPPAFNPASRAPQGAPPDPG